jgi:perosamine synthetase
VTTHQPRTTVPLSGAYLGEREEQLVLEVLRSGRLSLGPMIDRFEEMIAERVGAPYAVAVSSGTAGLHLLCRIASIQPGDEVITSPVSFVASANCFILEGGTPVFADVDPHTLNMDPASVEAAITERTKAIVAVDMFGYPCDLDDLRSIAAKHGLLLIEDAAEALGAVYKGRSIGSHGPSAVFGFYPNKQITTGEGGVVVTHSEEERRQLVSLRNQGRSYEGGGWFHHVQVGFNYRWTDIQAALGIAQLEKLDEILSLRRAAAERYTELLADVDVRPLTADDTDHVRSWFVYVVQVEHGVDRDGVMESLRADGIATAEYVPCVHLQPYMRELYGFSEGECPVAEDVSRRTLALPFHTGIDEAEQERVVDTLRRALG